MLWKCVAGTWWVSLVFKELKSTRKLHPAVKQDFCMEEMNNLRPLITRRTFVYSLLTRGRPFPVSVMVAAGFFCFLNGLLQSHYLLHCAQFDDRWLTGYCYKIGELTVSCLHWRVVEMLAFSLKATYGGKLLILYIIVLFCFSQKKICFEENPWLKCGFVKEEWMVCAFCDFWWIENSGLVLLF